MNLEDIANGIVYLVWQYESIEEYTCSFLYAVINFGGAGAVLIPTV
jgi:hypothetical protein